MDKFELARALFEPQRGGSLATSTMRGTAVSDSEAGIVYVDFNGEAVTPDDEQAVEVETTFPVREGDEVIVSLVGANGTGKLPIVIGVIGRGDEIQNSISAAATALADYIVTNNEALENLQSQIDGAINTWFYAYEPTLQNAPANEWGTTEEKDNHLGDLFYNTQNGYCYRFAYTSGAYAWLRVTDTDIATALANAAQAQETADGKATIFTGSTTPTDAQEGDVWFKGVNEGIYTYVNNAWAEYNKYTDDTTANAAQQTANDAESHAQTAMSNAATALSTANSANSTANTANTKANNAIVSQTNYYKLSASTPATPTESSHSGWSTAEPAWAANSTDKLYLSIRTAYGSGTVTWSAPAEVQAYANINVAKNAIELSVSETYVAQGDSNIETLSSTMKQDANGVNIYNDISAVGDTYAHIDGDEFSIRRVATAGEINQSDSALASFGREVTVGSRDTSGAVGLYSQVFGVNCVASGDYSHADGRGTKATGDYSHTEGLNTKAGNYAHAEGWGTLAGWNSHSEGLFSTTGYGGSHAEGSTYALCVASHSEGGAQADPDMLYYGNGGQTNSVYNLALGDSAHVEGVGTIATGSEQHASGKYNIIDKSTTINCIFGHYSNNDENTIYLPRLPVSINSISYYDEGEWKQYAGSYRISTFPTIPSGTLTPIMRFDSAIPAGMSLKIDFTAYEGKYAEIVGNGTSISARSNAYNLDWTGNAEFQGEVYVGGCTPNGETPYPVVRYNTAQGQPEYWDGSAWVSVGGGASKVILTATILAADWAGSGPYTNSVTVSGLLSTDTPIMDLVTSATYATAQSEISAYGNIYKAVCNTNGTLVVYATSAPTVDLNIQLLCVR